MRAWPCRPSAKARPSSVSRRNRIPEGTRNRARQPPSSRISTVTSARSRTVLPSRSMRATYVAMSQPYVLGHAPPTDPAPSDVAAGGGSGHHRRHGGTETNTQRLFLRASVPLWFAVVFLLFLFAHPLFLSWRAWSRKPGPQREPVLGAP